jgi:uncharacterized protein (TIGR00369 family)
MPELTMEVASADQPFSALVGAEVTSFGRGSAELSLEMRADLTQQHGFAHGCVLSYLADNALTFAGGSVLGPAVVTAEFKINYLRPAIGDRLVARASVLHAGSTVAVCRCDIHTVAEGVERLCATAQGSIVQMRSPAAGQS